jgi:hypothetical protein
MAKHDIDPVLRELVRSINQSGQAAVPVTVSAHGSVLTGTLIPQDSYFAELAGQNPLMSALEPASGLLGHEYAKDVDSESDYHLHLRAARVTSGSGGDAEGLWRISLPAVDAWALRATADAPGRDDRGPFARLLGGPDPQ